jgi:hypothetical protein
MIINKSKFLIMKKTILSVAMGCSIFAGAAALSLIPKEAHAGCTETAYEVIFPDNSIVYYDTSAGAHTYAPAGSTFVGYVPNIPCSIVITAPPPPGGGF